MSKNDGGPAFPGFGEIFTTDAQGRTGPQGMWGMHGGTGMTLRDYFAAKAIDVAFTLYMKPNSTATLSSIAYEIADAMLSERTKGETNG